MPKNKAPKFGPVAPAAGGGGGGSHSHTHTHSHSHSHSKDVGGGFTGGGGIY